MTRMANMQNPTRETPLSDGDDSDAVARHEISVAELYLRIHSPFFATLSLHAPKVLTVTVPTAATNGYDIFVNPAFFHGQANTKTRAGVLLHEVLHAAFMHVTRRGTRDPLLWNYAADIVVNGFIDAAGDTYALPAGVVRDAALAPLSVEEVYQRLMRDAVQVTLSLDLRDLVAEPGTSGSDAQTGQSSAPTTQENEPGQRGGSQRTPAAIQGYWRDAIERATTEAALAQQQGTMPAGLERELGALGAGRLDWRRYLWRYLVRTPVDFEGYDRRFLGDGLYLDALEGETLTVYVCVDTSGSIRPADLTAFASEIRGILASYPHVRCVVYYADAACYGPYALPDDGGMPPPQGGGGTDFRPFFTEVAQQVSLSDNIVTVYLTDGFGTFPQQAPPWPVLWVVQAGGADLKAFPFGETVRLITAE